MAAVVADAAAVAAAVGEDVVASSIAAVAGHTETMGVEEAGHGPLLQTSTSFLVDPWTR